MSGANLTPLLVRVKDAGLTLRADRGNLIYRPKDKLTPELRAELLAHKPELLELLQWNEDVAFALIGDALAYVAQRYRGEDTDALDEPGERIDDAFGVEDMHALRVAVRHYVGTAVRLFRSSHEGRAA